MVSIRQKSSSVAGKKPLPADLERAELAVNLVDKKIYSKDQTDAIVELGGGASDVPGLSDVTVKAAAPYDEPADDSGYLTRIGGKTAGDADEYQITRQNLAVSDTAPANPHVGMIWVDNDEGLNKIYLWNGVAWAPPGTPNVPPGAFVVTFEIEADNVTPASIGIKPSGATPTSCKIFWGDGDKTELTNFSAVTHTYAAADVYTLQIIIGPETTAIFDGNGWPTFSGCKVLKIGPHSSNTRINTYGNNYTSAAFYPDLVEMDFTGVTPLQLTNFISLFQHRLGLLPDNVKGLDPSKISSVKSLLRDRIDIVDFPSQFKNLPECTNIDYLAAGTSLQSVSGLDYPKATSAQHSFEGATIGTVGSINIPLAKYLLRMFYTAVINSFTTTITTSSAAADYKETVRQCSIANMNRVPIFSDYSGATSMQNMFTLCTAQYIIGSTVKSGVSLLQPFNNPNAKEISGWKFSNISTNGDNGVFGWGTTFPALEILEIEYSGTIDNSARNTNGAMCTPRAGQCPKLSQVLPNMFDGMTTFDPVGTNSSEELVVFTGAALPQAMIDNLINSLDRAMTAGCVLVPPGPYTMLMAGGSNSPPSAGVISGAIARLAAAGWTVTTN